MLKIKKLEPKCYFFNKKVEYIFFNKLINLKKSFDFLQKRVLAYEKNILKNYKANIVLIY